MNIYTEFKRNALIVYRTAIKTKGESLESAFRSRTYIFYTLHGMLHGVMMASVLTTAELKACQKYIDIVEKAFDKNHIKPQFGK